MAVPRAFFGPALEPSAPKAFDTLNVRALAAPFIVNTMHEATLKAFADPGEIGTILAVSDDDCDEVLANFAKAGVDIDALGTKLQEEGADSFVKSWNDLLECIASKSKVLKAA